MLPGVNKVIEIRDSEAVKAVEERDKNKSKSKTSPPPAAAEKEEEKKPGSGELPLFWCKPASNPATAVNTNDDKTLQSAPTPA